MTCAAYSCFHFILVSCHAFPGSPGWVWGGRGSERKALLIHTHHEQPANVNLNHNTDSLSGFLAAACRQSAMKIRLFVFPRGPLWLLPCRPLPASPPLLSPQSHMYTCIHPTCIFIFTPSHPEHGTNIYFTATRICTHRLDMFIHKLIRGVDLPAAIHHTVTHPQPGSR